MCSTLSKPSSVWSLAVVTTVGVGLSGGAKDEGTAEILVPLKLATEIFSPSHPSVTTISVTITPRSCNLPHLPFYSDIKAVGPACCVAYKECVRASSQIRVDAMVSPDISDQHHSDAPRLAAVVSYRRRWDGIHRYCSRHWWFIRFRAIDETLSREHVERAMCARCYQRSP
ncbi:hypothetical protein K474DRAFT_1463707 [Panus rudis PR-1116 ss-1]|nr:hypothetical protein K474DRAFT_1463707 [Panus rudis PR-1116 ss-1]